MGELGLKRAVREGFEISLERGFDGPASLEK